MGGMRWRTFAGVGRIFNYDKCPFIKMSGIHLRCVFIFISRIFGVFCIIIIAIIISPFYIATVFLCALFCFAVSNLLAPSLMASPPLFALDRPRFMRLQLVVIAGNWGCGW